MNPSFSPQQRTLLRQKTLALFKEHFDEDLSDFKADQILDALIGTLGPALYTAALEDMKAYMMNQLEDLDALFQP
jgi:uncharacterized protein (DUF2164 family)